MTADHATTTDNSVTLGALMAEAVGALRDAGIENVRMDARILLSDAAEVDGSRIAAWPEDVVANDRAAKFRDMVARRLKREPVSRILGQRDFWRHSFKLSPETLDPRPDSETLVELALDWLEDRDAPTVIDFGTGTGCLLLSIVGDLQNARGLGVDISAGAVACARENADRLDLGDQVEFRVSDWDSAITDEERQEGFDLVVSNPPYIAAGEMEGLSDEVRRHEPQMALTDGGDGLGAYRAIAAHVAGHLEPGGRLLVEIGPTQAAAVGAILAQAGLSDVTVVQDLDGRDRVVCAWLR